MGLSQKHYICEWGDRATDPRGDLAGNSGSVWYVFEDALEKMLIVVMIASYDFYSVKHFKTLFGEVLKMLHEEVEISHLFVQTTREIEQ